MAGGIGRERAGFVLAVLMCAAALVGTVAQGISARGEGTGGAGPGSEMVGREGGERPAFAEEDLEALCDPYEYEEVDLASSELDAAEEAAGGFVRAAYGYSGTDPDAYERGVEGRVVGECFRESDAGAVVAKFEEMVRQGGEANAPEDWYYLEGFVGFYVEGTQGLVSGDSGAAYPRVFGYAVWVSREARAEAGGEDALSGFQQGLTLARGTDGAWRVAYGEDVSAYTDSEYEYAVEQKMKEIRGEGATMQETAD